MWVLWLYHPTPGLISYLKQMSVSCFIKLTFLTHIQQRTNESERLLKLLPFVSGDKTQSIVVEINSCDNKGNRRDLFEVGCFVILCGFKYPKS